MNLSLKNSAKSALLAATAGAMVFAGTGMASATHLPAVGQTPTAANQVCGVVKNAAGMGIHGATVTGALVPPPGAPWTASTTTDAAGGWCLQGTGTMADQVQGGATVNLVATDGASTQSITGIGVSSFLSHAYWGLGIPPKSAWNYNFVL